VASALDCSLAIRGGFEARARGGLTPELRVRIGIAAGEPVDHNDDLFGSTVTLASRICGAAEAGRILTSELVRDLGIERGFAFGVGGDVVLKGISGPTRVFELAPPEGTRPLDGSGIRPTTNAECQRRTPPDASEVQPCGLFSLDGRPAVA
jgi:class 3 adenylate cyclase